MSETHLGTAIHAAFRAGREILSVYSSMVIEVQHKEDHSPLTEADLRAHRTIMETLAPLEIPVLSEEGRQTDYSVRSRWDKLWIVDPLDGTKEFLKRNGEFTVNIALVENGKPVLGVVFVPVLKTLYIGGPSGAYKYTGDQAPVSSSGEPDYNRMEKLPKQRSGPFTVVGSRSHMSEETAAYFRQLEVQHGELNIVSMGSSLKLCLVAEGIADEYPRFAPTMEWDTAAGQAVCEAAGAVVYRYPEFKPLTYNREELLNPWFLVKRV